ncbi:insecticidal delta-endotoxin Cry8Ea1 family protein [Bacillus toyonensis]|uniref:insecticidal delta-endotoxin Cry8Ea1 family protein n=1 Tax=Bacillus toyonensis TaxID=155322 RepID=UPI003D64CE2A
MKYKNRKNAKRKYKQALLATVATMTLGLNVVEGASPALAAESTSQSEESTSALNKLMTMENLKKVGTLTADVLKTAYTDAHENNGNYNNTFRNLAMGGTALIPYGGVFVSGLIGLIWPVNTDAQKNQMKKLIDELGNMMDNKITDNEIATIESEVNTLKERLQKFEKNINMNISAEGLYSLTTKEQALAQDAKDISNKFSDIIGHCTQKLQVIPALPIYTQLATAHLEFLQFLAVNGTGPKLQYTTAALNTLLKGEQNENFKQRINTLAETYRQHINATYKLAEQKINEKIRNIANNSPLDDMNKCENEDEMINAMQTAIIKWHPLANNYTSMTKKLRDDINDIITLKTKRKELLATTVGNEAFQKIAIGEWDSHKTVVNLNHIKQTGWVYLKNNWYYLSPDDNIKNLQDETFKKGHMVTNQIEIDHKTYFFDLDTGAMTTRWATKEGHYFYVSPYDGFKNWSGVEFKQGELVTGWLELSNRATYYLSPAADTQNDEDKNSKTFAKGEMMTGWIKVKGASYYMDNKEGNKDFQGVTGRMLRGTNNGNGFSVNSGKSPDDFKAHQFNDNGTWL